MRVRTLISLVSALLLAAGPGLRADPAHAAGDEAGYSDAETEILIDQWYAENDACRGGSGDDEKTFEHCDARDAITEQLRKLGLCYGHDGQAEYQREWEPCAD